MVTEIQWIPFRQLVLDPERAMPPHLFALERPTVPRDGAPLVMVTPDRRVIAGRACLEAGPIGDQELIPCRVVQPNDIDITLTALHNKVLYGQLGSEELSLHLEIYAELCRHLQLRAALEERQHPPGGETPNAEDDSR